MKLSGLIDALIAAGGSMEQVRAVVSAAEKEQERAEEQRLAKLRAGNAERQRRSRLSRVTTVTTRDERDLSPPPAPSPEPPTPPAPTHVETPPPTGGAPKAAKRRSQIAADAQPTPADRQAADEAGMSPATFRTEWGLFRDHHIAEASTMADWQAAWRTWVGKWVKWGCKQHGAPIPFPVRSRDRPPSNFDSSASALRRLMGTPDESDDHHGSDWNRPEIELTAVSHSGR